MSTLTLVTKKNGKTTKAGKAEGEKYKIRVIERAMGVLDVLHSDGPQLTLSEIAERLELHKSTVHRLLMVLERQRFVERSPRNSKYQLGLRLFELGWSARANRDVPELATPFLRRLVDETGERLDDITEMFNSKWFYDFLEEVLKARLWGFGLIQLEKFDPATLDINVREINRDHVRPDLNGVVKTKYDNKAIIIEIIITR